MNQPKLLEHPTFRRAAADARCDKCGKSYYTHRSVGREEVHTETSVAQHPLVMLCTGEVVVL